MSRIRSLSRQLSVGSLCLALSGSLAFSQEADELGTSVSVAVEGSQKEVKDADILLEPKPVPATDILEVLPVAPTELTELTELPDAPVDPNAKTADWRTQTEARIVTLGVPAPRGQITDRNGVCLANNKVGYYHGIQFPLLESPSDEEIVAFARERIGFIEKRIATSWTISDKKILEHYKNRRWLPLLNRNLMRAENWQAVSKLKKGVIAQPSYYRSYPHNRFAGHILGYAGRVRNMPTGPIGAGEVVAYELEGKSGLEQKFEQSLAGKQGELNIQFDADGKKTTEDVITRPRPGNNVVTTLIKEWQDYAEARLAAHLGHRRGAFVIVDIHKGDILALASYPHFDPNDFVPSISSTRYRQLADDGAKPLFPRAYAAAYPPASTFKVPVALGILETGKVTPTTRIKCPASMNIRGLRMRNHSRYPQGPYSVVSALKKSCNTWFFQAANRGGAPAIISMASRCGVGQKTGIPLAAESAGFLPTNEWTKKTFGVTIQGSQLANISIGQGKVSCTPLQVAMYIAAIANGKYLPQARLVKQIQDIDGNVIQAFPSRNRNALNVNPKNLKAVRDGMYAVVNAGDGTGKKGGIGACKIAGKTGTGQWRTNKGRKQNVAWFCGYAPADRPQYAFAVVYEGSPGQSVSGGKQAAPIASSVMSKVYAWHRARGLGIYDSAADVKTAKEDDNQASSGGSSKKTSSSSKKKSSSSKKKSTSSRKKSSSKKKSTPKKKRTVRKAQPVKRNPAPAAPAPKKKKNIFQRIFGGKKR